MLPVIKNILFPVNLREDTELQLEEAIRFANRLQSNLHLLVTVPRRNLMDLVLKKHSKRLQEKKKALLDEINQHYSRYMSPGSSLLVHIGRGTPLKDWMNYMLANRIDLLYLDESAVKEKHLLHHAQQKGAAMSSCLLTSYPSAELTGVKNIILPIGDSLPLNRIRITAFLAHQLNATIHLVSNQSNGHLETNMAYLRKTYQLLVDYTKLHVVCSTLPGGDLRHSTWEYARSVNAGLIVAKSDLRSPSFLHKLFPAKHSDISLLLLDN